LKRVIENRRSVAMSSPSSNEFTLDDFKRMMLKILNPSLMKRAMMTFAGAGELLRETTRSLNAKRELNHTIGIIDAMTAEERRQPKLIDSSRERRIAAGAGVATRDVRNLIKQYMVMRPIMTRNPRDFEPRDLRLPKRQPPFVGDGPDLAG
jgi:signal recognition particle subunit SRP54